MSKDDNRPDIRHEDQSPILDFPDGDGDPNCEKCRGRGVTTKMIDAGGGLMWPGGTEICVCVYKRDLEANVKRIWPVLLNVESVDESPLLQLTNQSLWVTANTYDLRRHLRYTAYRMGPSWDAFVVTDSKIITSWLSTVKYAHDPDVTVERERSSDEYMTIEDIAVPFGLLIIVLGVKAAKNKEMPNVLLEAINERDVRGKPTWVVDSPLRPLQEGHICYNDAVEEVLCGFRRVVLSEAGFTQMDFNQGRTSTTSAHRAYKKIKPGMSSVQSADSVRVSKPRPRLYSGEASEVVASHPPQVKQPPPQVKQPPPQVTYDDDDVSVDALVAGAVDLPPVPQTYPDEFSETDSTVAEVQAYKPTTEELGQDDEMAERAKAAMAKPKPKGRRKFRGFNNDGGGE